MNVMIVDDEWLVRHGLRTLLPWEQFQMQVAGEANDGEEALEMLKELPIDIMFVDLTMPIMDGFELMRIMRERHPLVKIVVLTCHQEFDYLQEAMRMGAIDYIVKTQLVKEKMAETLKRIATRVAFERHAQGTIDAHARARPLAVAPVQKYGVLLMALEPGNKVEQLAGVPWLSGQNLIPIREGAWFLPQLQTYAGKEMDDFLYGVQGPEWVLIKVEGHEGKHIEQIKRMLQAYMDNELFYTFRPLTQIYEASLGSAIKERTMGPLPFDQLRSTWRSFYWLFDDAAYAQALQAVKAAGMGRAQAWAFFQSLGQDYAEMLHRQDYALLQRSPDSVPFATWHQLEKWLLHTRKQLAKGLSETFSVEIIRNITKAVAYLEQNLDERISQDEIAGIASMSRSYFSVCFKNVLQQTFSDYLRDMRLKKAVLYLLETDEPIQWISAQTGFMDEKYFSKLFRNKTGMLPTAYRKHHRYEARS